MQFCCMLFLRRARLEGTFRAGLACPRKRELSKLLKEAEEAELEQFKLGFWGFGDGLGLWV